MNTIHQLTPLLVAILSLAAVFAFSMTATYIPPTPTKIGNSNTVVWGTAPGGTPTAPVVASMIITSFDLDPRNPEAVGEIENGDGAVITSVYLLDGFKGTVEGVYDSTLTYPAMYSAVVVVLPKALSLSGNAAAVLAYGTYNCVVESNAAKFKRKGEAMVSFKISHAPGRDGNPTA